LRSALDLKKLEDVRRVINQIQDAVDDKKMCSYLSESAIKTLLESGKEVIYVGTGSAGSRIYIDSGRLYTPVGDGDLRQGIGKRVQDNFRKLFGIVSDDLEITF